MDLLQAITAVRADLAAAPKEADGWRVRGRAINIQAAKRVRRAQRDRVRQRCARDGARRQLGAGHNAIRQLRAGDGSIGHVDRHHRVTDRADALVGRQLLKSARAVVEPYPQTHVGVGKHGGRNGGHVGERGIPQQHGEKAASHHDRNGGCRLAAVDTGAVIAPVGWRAVAVDQRELELAWPAEVRAAGKKAALVADELGHLSAGNTKRQQSEDQWQNLR